MAENQEATTPPEPPPRLPWYKQLWAIRITLVIILTPILLIPLPAAYPTREVKCAYVILIMAIYWCTEALPMAVTALLPVVLMPWLDVASSKRLCSNYLKDANMLFFGGLLVAVAVEKWGLHKRVALRVLMLVGSKPIWILFGFMSVTGFLSMWLSNTAAAAMMIPIACAVLKELDDHRKSQRVPGDMEMRAINGADDAPPAEGQSNDATVVVLDGSKKRGSKAEKEPLKDSAALEVQYAHEDKQFKNFSCALKLCIAYAANVGGTGTIIGCGPNIVMKGMADQKFGQNHGVDFTSWFIMCFPFMAINLVIAWMSLVLLFIGPKEAFGRGKNEEKSETGEDVSANAVIRREYVKLGTMTFAEIMVLVSFIILALLWLTKKPGVFPGWLYLMPEHSTGPYVTDSSVAITVCFVLFILPSQPPNYLCFGGCNKGNTRAIGPAPPILDWPTVNRQMPWSVILLLGGGFALADACEVSGLSKAIGNFLTMFEVLPPWSVVLIMVIVGTTFTTFTSNVSTTTILVPIVMQLAEAIKVHPLYMMIPTTISASFSYILPVSTPPNAIVYAYGDITMMDMIKTGLVNAAAHILVLMLAANTWGAAIFGFFEYPDWAPQGAAVNGTMALNTTVASPLFTTSIL